MCRILDVAALLAALVLLPSLEAVLLPVVVDAVLLLLLDLALLPVVVTVLLPYLDLVLDLDLILVLVPCLDQDLLPARERSVIILARIAAMLDVPLSLEADLALPPDLLPALLLVLPPDLLLDLLLDLLPVLPLDLLLDPLLALINLLLDPPLVVREGKNSFLNMHKKTCIYLFTHFILVLSEKIKKKNRKKNNTKFTYAKHIWPFSFFL